MEHLAAIEEVADIAFASEVKAVCDDGAVGLEGMAACGGDGVWAQLEPRRWCAVEAG